MVGLAEEERKQQLRKCQAVITLTYRLLLVFLASGDNSELGNMRKSWIYGLIGLTIAAAPALAFQNEPTGFRGLQWGTDIATVKDSMSVVEDAGATKYYHRAGDALTLGGATLKEISYGFYKGKLEVVILETAAGSDQALLDAFSAQYGSGQKSNQFMRDIFWQGATASAGVTCNDIANTCNGIIKSVAIEAVENADKANAAATAGKDF